MVQFLAIQNFSIYYLGSDFSTSKSSRQSFGCYISDKKLVIIPLNLNDSHKRDLQAFNLIEATLPPTGSFSVAVEFQSMGRYSLFMRFALFYCKNANSIKIVWKYNIVLAHKQLTNTPIFHSTSVLLETFRELLLLNLTLLFKRLMNVQLDLWWHEAIKWLFTKREQFFVHLFIFYSNWKLTHHSIKGENLWIVYYIMYC